MGCDKSTEYAYGFTREFVDARERDNIQTRTTKEKSMKAMNLHNNEAGRIVSSNRRKCQRWTDILFKY